MAAGAAMIDEPHEQFARIADGLPAAGGRMQTPFMSQLQERSEQVEALQHLFIRFDLANDERVIVLRVRKLGQ